MGSTSLICDIHQRTGIDLLVPLPNRKTYRKVFEAIPEEQFTRRWAGFATAKRPIELKTRNPGKYYQFVERYGERPDDYQYKGFLCTSDREEVEAVRCQLSCPVSDNYLGGLVVVTLLCWICPLELGLVRRVPGPSTRRSP